MNCQARDDAVEIAALPGGEPTAEIHGEEADASVARGRLQRRTQLVVGLGVGGGAIDADDFGQPAHGRLPQRACELPAAAAPIEPLLQVLWVEPRFRRRPEFLIML